MLENTAVLVHCKYDLNVQNLYDICQEISEKHFKHKEIVILGHKSYFCTCYDTMPLTVIVL